MTKADESRGQQSLEATSEVGAEPAPFTSTGIGSVTYRKEDPTRLSRCDIRARRGAEHPAGTIAPGAKRNTT